MADFTSAQIPIQTASPSGGQAAQRAPSAVSTALSFASALIPTKAQLDDNAKKKKAATAASTTELYTQEALRLADAVDLGEMSSNVARARMRRLYSTYAANNPMLQDELFQTHSRILSTSGLGKVVADGTEQEQMQSAVREEVYKAGFINDTMSPEVQDEMIERFQSFKVNERLLEIETQKLNHANAEIANVRGRIGIQSDQIGLQRARVGLQNDSIEQQTKILGLEQKRAQYRAEQAMVGLASDYGPVFRERATQIISGIPENAPPERRAQAEAQLQQLWSETVGGVVGGLGAGASTGMVDMATRPMKDWFDYTLRVARGEDSIASLETHNNISMQREILNGYLDPETRAMAANVKMLGESVVLGAKANEVAMRAFTNSVARNAVPPVSSPEFADLANFSTETWKAAADGRMSPESTEEVQTNLNNILGSIGGLRTTDASSLNEAADALSSVEYGAYIDKLGSTGFDKEAAAGAQTVFDEFYVQELIPLVREEWQKSSTTAPLDRPDPYAFRARASERPAAESVQVRFSGSGVRFVPTEGTDASRARHLNSQLAPVLNKLIRLGSHLDGHTNYRNFFEQNYSELFQTEVIRDDGAEE